MQTFLSDYSFTHSARVLDDRRLGKQRVEAWQIYNTLKRGKFSECPKCLGSGFWSESGECEAEDLCPKCHGTGMVKTPWYNHPAVQMWKGYEGGIITLWNCGL